ncbi:MAG TPA: hypothetical protein VGR82_17080 [Methylomirabilota bacterium]|jgi:hypothetical protein|nr:hypothetical protein [Methylomirabilota bacterium]
MPPSAHTALVVSIVASALGALVMCLLVARYGLSSASTDEGERGLLVTRFGHALAGVCFAATGILAVVALVAPTREPRPAPTTIVKLEPDRAAEARLQALAAEVKAMAARLDQAESRMTVVDSAARRLGDEVGSMSARAKQLERTLAALPRRAVVAPPAPKATPAPPVPPVTADMPAVPPAPTPATPPPTPEPMAAPRPRMPEPVAHRSQPIPARASEPAASPRVAPSSGRATIEAPAGGAAVAKPDDGHLSDKMRDDWKTIRGGFSTAGDDFKSALRDLGRKLWR